MARSALARCGCLVLCALRLGECAGPRDGVRLDDAGVPEDSLALIQQGAQPRRHQARAPARRFGASLRVGTSDPEGASEISDVDLYCAAYPAFCQAPFNCTDLHQEMVDHWGVVGMAADGKPNYFNWCLSPNDVAWMSKCAAGDLIGSAQMHLLLTKAGMYGGLTTELDGSFCFLEGLCADTAVTENTTAEEAAKMCDDLYGHEAWTLLAAPSSPPENLPGFGLEGLIDQRNGFESRVQTRPYSLAACATGSFHCNVMYCKEHYCKDEYYVKKYGHFLKEGGWVK